MAGSGQSRPAPRLHTRRYNDVFVGWPIRCQRDLAHGHRQRRWSSHTFDFGQRLFLVLRSDEHRGGHQSPQCVPPQSEVLGLCRRADRRQRRSHSTGHENRDCQNVYKSDQYPVSANSGYGRLFDLSLSTNESDQRLVISLRLSIREFAVAGRFRNEQLFRHA